ncbi:hypothetical protein GCM10027445_21320 [Amycolatopsis endophytica]
MVTGKQGERGFAGTVIESPLESREIVEQLGSQTVDRSGAIADQVGAARGQDPQVHTDFVAWPQRLQVAPHAGLVCDDRGVLGIGLAVSAVAGCRVVDGAAGNVEQALIVVDQQRQQQRRASAVEIDRPGCGAFAGEFGNVGEEFQQRRLVVGDSPGQPSFPVGVHHDAMVMRFACVDSGPELGHGHLLLG